MNMMKKITFILSLALISLATNKVHGQVSFSPTIVFLDNQTNVGSFFVSNPGNSAVEVRISFEFAYSQTDEYGNRSFNYDDSEAEERYSLKPYLRAFPTTFVLQPDERQTVRLVGRLPSNLNDGRYWARMRISSNQVTPPIGEVDEGQVTAQIGFQIDQVTSIYAQHGNANTGLQVHSSKAELQDNRAIILTDVERTGNSPFLGSFRTRLLSSNNEEIVSRRSSTTVYFRNTVRSEFDASNLPAGEYTVETTFESQRNDISSHNLLQINPIIKRTTLTIE